MPVTNLLFLCALQVSPLFAGLSQVQSVEGKLHLPDDVVLGEAVVVVHGHHQRLPAHLRVGNLEVARTRETRRSRECDRR